MDSTNTLRSKLDEAYAAIVKRAPSHPAMIAYLLVDLCGSADFHFMYLSPEQAAIHGFRFQKGWQRALELFLPGCMAPERLVRSTLLSTPQRKMFADSLLQDIGDLEYTRYVLEHCHDGLARLREENGDFIAEYLDRRQGVELLEERDYRWVVEHMPAWHETRISQRKKWSNILKQMRKRVYIDKGHFLGYRCTPDIDKYFHRESLLYSQQRIGYDAFPSDAKFGGIPFGIYREATRHVVDWTLKHQQFTQQLYANNKRKLDMRNLVTLCWRQEDVIRDLTLLLGMPKPQATTVVDTLVLRSTDAKFLEAQGLPQPPYVSLGNGYLIKSMAGALANPFSFVLRQLEAQHPTDYSREHIRREGIFREQLYEIFSRPGLIKVDRSVDLTQDKRLVTDLDATILDPEPGTIGLFQLKWQDAFGGSMAERRSKQRNLGNACTEWIEAVLTWLDKNGIDELWNRLQLRKKQRFPVRRIRLFVLGRNFSQFSGANMPDERAAWGNWYQVRRLTETSHMDQMDPVAWLHEQLVVDSPYRRRSELALGDEEGVSIGSPKLLVKFLAPG